MSPLFDFHCLDCNHRFECLVRTPAEEKLLCPACNGSQLRQEFPKVGGYKINGANDASVRPKQAGSFKK